MSWEEVVDLIMTSFRGISTSFQVIIHFKLLSARFTIVPSRFSKNYLIKIAFLLLKIFGLTDILFRSRIVGCADYVIALNSFDSQETANPVYKVNIDFIQFC